MSRQPTDIGMTAKAARLIEAAMHSRASRVEPKSRKEARMNVDLSQFDRQRSEAEADLVLIRNILGLSPIHDPVAAVKLLFEKGRAEFEATRGPVHSITTITRVLGGFSALLHLERGDQNG